MVAEATQTGPGLDAAGVPGVVPAFGPASVGPVAPPSLDQMVLRARARLTERERSGGRLVSIAGVLFTIPFMIDAMAVTGVITSGARLSTSPLLRGLLLDWSQTLVDTAVVAAELVLIIGCFAGAARFNAGRPKGAWVVALLGALGLLIWVPVMFGAATEIMPKDWVGALLASIFPGLGFLACLLTIVGGLHARFRPVRPYSA